MRAKWKEAKNTFPKIKLAFCSINDTHTGKYIRRNLKILLNYIDK